MYIIPLAGSSSRFFKKNYDTVKYKLPLFNNLSVFENIILNFDSKNPILIILNRKFSDRNWIEKIILRNNFKLYDIVEIENTKGQLDSVIKGIKLSRFINYSEPIWIYNGDTVRLIDPYDYNYLYGDFDGIIEVFNHTGNHWSFIDDLNVKNVVEKKRISNYASTGLYGFKNLKLIFQYINSYNNEKEYYVAPFYNTLISNKKKIKGIQVNKKKFILCGTPDEYEANREQFF